MNYIDLSKKIQQNVKQSKCSNKGCLSNNKDNQEIVWFGNQYQHKIITCTACLIMNDQATKKCLPTSQNIVPVSYFVNTFTNQLKKYNQKKSSSEWLPSELKERQKKHMAELDNFQFKLSGTLKSLGISLQQFGKKVIQSNQQIYNNQIFNEIIEMYSNNTMEQSLQKIVALINFLNYGFDEKYRFDDVEFKAKRTSRLQQKIRETTKKVSDALQQLLQQIQEKNSIISQI